MKFLHLSDIHINDDSVNSHELREKLPTFLQKQNITVDTMFVTGDFRHARIFYEKHLNADEVAKAVVNYLLQIAECVSVSREHIFIVPGNHDLDWDTSPKGRKRLKTIRSDYDPKRGEFSREDEEYLLNRFGFFSKVESLLYLDEPLWSKNLIPYHMFKDIGDFSLVLMNTAITCGLGSVNHVDLDRGQMVIGTKYMADALSLAKAANKPIIALAHHGLDMYAPEEKHEIEHWLHEFGVQLFLCGDAHLEWPRRYNNVLEITAGCFIQESGAHVFFSLCELAGSGKLTDIHAFEWDANNHGWQENTAFVDKLKKIINVPSCRPATTITVNEVSRPSHFFLGRRDKLKEIKERIISNDDNDQVLFITGIGGIGKTELCRKLYSDIVNQGLSGIEKVGWINFSESIEQSLFNYFKDEIIKSSKTIEEYLPQVLSYLREQGNRLILFIDNANDLSINDLRLLERIKCKLVITSRCPKVERIIPLKLDVLSKEDSRELYFRHLGTNNISKEALDKLLDKAGWHTLAVELLAKVQATTGFSIDKLLEELISRDFDLKGKIEFEYLPEQGKDVELEKEFIEQFAKVYEISNIEEGEERRVLQLFSLIAPEPVNKQILQEWFSLDGPDILNNLAKKGWITDLSDGMVMHPIIAAVVRHKAWPDTELLIPLWSSLARSLTIQEDEIITVVLPYLPHGLSVAQKLYVECENFSLLCHQLGFLYYHLAKYGEAREWFNKALAIREKVLGKEHPDIAVSYNCIASIYEDEGKYGEALDLFYKAITIFEKVLGKEHPNLASTFNNIAVVFKNQGKYDEALEWNYKSLTIREKVLGKEHQDTATTYDNIAVTYCGQGKYDVALEWHFKALTVREKVLGKEHPDTASTYNNIAIVYEKEGKYDEALKWYYKALAIREEVLGKEHPGIAAIYNNIAAVVKGQCKYTESLEWFYKALKIYEKTLGPDHPDTAICYSNIAVIYERQGKYDEAQEWNFKALAIREKVLGKEHLFTAVTYDSIANVYESQSKYDKAQEWNFKALAIREKVLGKDHPDTASTYNNIAVVYEREGKYDEALEWYNKTLAIREKVLGKEHPDTAATYNNIAVVFIDQGKYNEALKLNYIVLAIREKVLGKEHLDTAVTYHNIALVFNNQGKYDEALEWYYKALVIREKVLGKEHPDVTSTYNNITLVLTSQGKYDEALELGYQVLAIREKVLGKEHPDTAMIYINIAVALTHQGKYDEALKWFYKALTIFEKMLGENHPLTATSYHNIAGVYGNQGKYDEALGWYYKALAIREKVLGKEHPDTVATCKNIGIVLHRKRNTTKL